MRLCFLIEQVLQTCYVVSKLEKTYGKLKNKSVSIGKAVTSIY